MKCHAKQATFLTHAASGIACTRYNPRGEIHEDRARRRRQIGNRDNSAALLHHEEAVCFSRRRNNRRWIGEGQTRKRIGSCISERWRVGRHPQSGISNPGQGTAKYGRRDEGQRGDPYEPRSCIKGFHSVEKMLSSQSKVKRAAAVDG